MDQSDLGGGGNHTKTQYTHFIMIILCQVDFKEQTNKLVSMLLYTNEMC